MTGSRRRAVSVNDRGHVVGEGHHNAGLTDHEVDLVHALRAEGLTFAQIAQKMDISKGHAHDIIKGRRRGHTVVDQRTPRQSKTRWRPAQRAGKRRPARPWEFERVRVDD